MGGDHPNYNIIEISQNTEESPRNLRRLVMTQTSVLENKRMSGDPPNYSIVEIGQNTEKIPGDLRKVAVTKYSSAWK